MYRIEVSVPSKDTLGFSERQMLTEPWFVELHVTNGSSTLLSESSIVITSVALPTVLVILAV